MKDLKLPAYLRRPTGSNVRGRATAGGQFHSDPGQRVTGRMSTPENRGRGGRREWPRLPGDDAHGDARGANSKDR